MRFERVGKTVKANGERVITYISHNPEGWKLESRREQIPHSGRPGTWEKTFYYVIAPDGTEEKRYSLRDAAEKAAEMART